MALCARIMPDKAKKAPISLLNVGKRKMEILMNVLFFWERAGGLTLNHKCNPYGPLLSLAFEKIGFHLELGDYAFEKEWLKEKRTPFKKGQK